MARKTERWAPEPAPAPQPAPQPTPPPSQTFEFGDRDDRFTGTSGQEVIYGGGGNDTLDGAAGDNVLFGQNGRDVLLGGTGNDYVSGGEGLDVLIGGAGADQFAFDGNVALDGGEVDVIRDFGAGEGDRIYVSDVLSRVSSTGEDPYAAGYVQAVEVSGGVQIQVDPDGGGNAFRTLALLGGTSLAALGNDYLFLG